MSPKNQEKVKRKAFLKCLSRKFPMEAVWLASYLQDFKKLVTIRISFPERRLPLHLKDTNLGMAKYLNNIFRHHASPNSYALQDWGHEMFKTWPWNHLLAVHELPKASSLLSMNYFIYTSHLYCLYYGTDHRNEWSLCQLNTTNLPAESIYWLSLSKTVQNILDLCSPFIIIGFWVP